MDGALTLAAESDLEEQQPTPRAPLDCLTATLDSKRLVGDGGQEPGRRKPRILLRIVVGEDTLRGWQVAREEICCPSAALSCRPGSAALSRGAQCPRKGPRLWRAWAMAQHLAQLPAVWGLRKASAAALPHE